MDGMVKSWSGGKIKVLLSLLLILGTTYDLNGIIDDGKGRGLSVPTPAEKAHAQNKWPKVKSVKPNDLGAARIQAHMKQRGREPITLDVASSTSDEIALHYSFSYKIPKNSAIQTPLPSSVDNSLYTSFPPIGDQQRLGSCVAWASTYYQASHELGLVNGYDNKSGFDHILSPKWTYNILNGGSDEGLSIIDAYQLLAQNGAASLVEFPYDNNFLAWDLNKQDWIDAISNRTALPQLVSGIGGKKQDLTLIKQLLNNGHVLTMATYVDSWVYTKIKSDPANPNSPHVGEQAVSWMNGTEGGHCITIVGYDDNVWIDINGNGKVDPGEKGAFLLANSWGPDWGNHGFIWVSYDAFLARSAVAKGPNTGRVPLADAFDSNVVSIVPKAANYKPSLIAQFGLLQSERDKINVSAGSSDTTMTKPLTTITSCALKNTGGDYDFSGKFEQAGEEATFAIDLTDLLPSNNSSTQRYYLVLDEDVAGYPTTLSSFTLMDMAANQKVDYGNLPVVDSEGTISPYIDYAVKVSSKLAEKAKKPALPKVIDTTPPVVKILSPAHGSIIKSGVVSIEVSAIDDVAIQKVVIFWDAKEIAQMTTPPYSVTVDTAMCADGTHRITAMAHDTSNNSAMAEISLVVKNGVK